MCLPTCVASINESHHFVSYNAKRKRANCVCLKTYSAILPVDLNLSIYFIVRRHQAAREIGLDAHGSD